MKPGEVRVRVAGRALGLAPAAEIAGTVVAAGEAASEWLGRRVVVPRLLPCGECDACRRARPASCPDRVRREERAAEEIVPARFLCSVEPPLWPAEARTEDLLWRLAALADQASAPFGALARGGLGPSERLIVVGGGVRGAFATAIARAKGASAIVLDDREPLRARAGELGAIETLPLQIGRDALAPHLSAGSKIIETTGTVQGRAQALALARGGETVLLLEGAGAEPVPVDWDAMVRGEIDVICAGPCHPDLFPELMALVVRGELPLERLTCRPDEDPDALAILTP